MENDSENCRAADGLGLERAQQGNPPMLLNEVSNELQQEIDLIDAILQAPDKKARREAILQAAETLGKTTRTIRSKMKNVQDEGVAILAVGRKDKGQFRIPEQWFKFIVKIYEWGQREGSRINTRGVHVHLVALASQGEALRDKKYANGFKGYPKVLEDLIVGKHPSHPTVYKVVNFHLEQTNKNVRHPGSPAEGQIIQTTEGIIELTHSNQVWQCDHTKLDILLVDADREVILEWDDDKKKDILGRPYLTLIMDSYSGCVVGFYLGFEAAGSHEVGLALRHAILPKQYGSEYELQQEWQVFGKPVIWLTDRAKEFKSNHLKQISMQLGFKRRLRAFPSAGGLIESIFDKINKELLSHLPGYTGSNVKERPKEAEKYACLTLDELEKLLVRYFVDHYNQHDYPRVANQKRVERWKAALLADPEVLSERDLDICLMKTAKCKVQKHGSVQFATLVYQGDCLVDYEGDYVSLRYDQRNILTLLAYTFPKHDRPGELIGAVHARDEEKEQLSLEELEWTKRKLKKQGKEVDRNSIWAERLGLYGFVEEKRKSKRQRRRKAQQQHSQETNQSQVVELFPQNVAPENQPEVQENIASTADQHQTDIVESTYTPASSESIAPDVVAYDWSQLLEDNW
ncbi:transposase [Leptolyngbya sp. FACHB-541]|uniref:Mu transposase C-terminal domain-containing protein n=1 Tax=Leptolyngbya sp. FACHB-541 TaxID=2692810 RepID=UPI00168A246E|nr:Mu transposase C-terminal domain-containing protein [Leptolyngbya sp. FACHB-541]MBD1998442.1 transposase [Leptolyngbya sp. FACHB-541]